jgi:hypothetical protein
MVRARARLAWHYDTLRYNQALRYTAPRAGLDFACVALFMIVVLLLNDAIALMPSPDSS